MTFRIFTNDRGKKRGVFMYSGYRDVRAPDAKTAESLAEHRYGPFSYRDEHGPVKAIEWPPQTQDSKDWLAKHVG